MNMAQAVARYHLKVRRCPIKTLNRVLSKDGHPAEKIGDITIFTFREGVVCFSTIPLFICSIGKIPLRPTCIH